MVAAGRDFHNFNMVYRDDPTSYVAATQAQADEIIDPRSVAVNEITALYAQYPHIGCVLPAVGYHAVQLAVLRETINRADVDVIVSATPCNLDALIELNKPVARARYEFSEVGEPALSSLVERFLNEQHTRKRR